MSNKSALDTQIDGNHYKDQPMQPLELAYRVNGSPCFTKLAKYASRRKVDRLGDLKKAIHCIQLEEELVAEHGNSYEKLRIPSPAYIKYLNNFCGDNDRLWLSLVHMYLGEYSSAIKYIQEMLQDEFPDEA